MASAERGEHIRRATLACLTAMLVLVGLPAGTALAADHLEVVLLDAGHGDTVLYRGPCGEVGILDVNRSADEVLD